MKKKKVTRSSQKGSHPPVYGESQVISSDTLPIVGIGASAGGLEALEQLLGHTSPNSGMAFVIIQHLDPTQKGIMPELLQRATTMKVLQVIDQTRVEANHVYVIPPKKDMSILHGVLHLLEPAAPRGLRLPIDFFFRSLAEDQGEHSIGVILSGMGSDGTLGLRAIKENAGLVLVQDPASAKFDSMPRCAIETGLVDIVAPVAGIPEKIQACLRRRTLVGKTDRELQETAKSALEKTVLLLRKRTGHDFSHYKHNTLFRRIERRMGIHQIDKMDGYIHYLQENPQELDFLFKELLIGVTKFFRDVAAWNELEQVAIPALLAARPTGKALRVWVPGCSSGEEAYSMAMLLKEAVDAFSPRRPVPIQIFATDLDSDAINKARYGLFKDNIVADVSAERLDRFFFKEDEGYRVRREIRDMVVFATQNLIMDPPFTKLDILSCRNVLIYLAPEVQKKLIPLFNYSLNPGGILFFGSAETVGYFTHLFTALPGNANLYQRRESTIEPGPLEFPTYFSAHLSGSQDGQQALKKKQGIQELADKLVLESYAPSAALVNDKGDILYISGRTGKYLEPPAGKVNWNIFAMVRKGLSNELYSSFQKALRNNGKVTVRGLEAEPGSKDPRVQMTVERLETPEQLEGLMMVVFTDLPAPEPSEGARALRSQTGNLELEALQRALFEAREDARLTRESMQTTQQELRSTNEELQSTNEELQSTNEELMTSKEEMQSLNEELQTVNSEMHAKVGELSQTSNDMKNLLDSTEIATVFLDNHLNVRRYTEQATKIIKLIPSDLGRPIMDMASQLCYNGLEEDSRGVLQTQVAKETPVNSRDGSWFTVRIMPYRTLDNRIDGVVITFADITVARGDRKRDRGGADAR